MNNLSAITVKRLYLVRGQSESPLSVEHTLVPDFEDSALEPEPAATIAGGEKWSSPYEEAWKEFC